MDLEAIRNDLGSLINQTDDSGVFTSTLITTAEADRWINQAFQEVYMWYALANKESFEQEATVSLAADTSDYTFGGDATDILAIRWLGLKYNTTDTDYTRAKPRSQPDTIIVGNEEFPEGAPVYYRITKKVSGVPTSGVRISATPENTVTAGLKIIYIERPDALTLDADTPERIPLELQKYIALGASVNCLFKMDEDDKAERRLNLFNSKIQQFVMTDQTLTSDQPKRVRQSRDSYHKFYKRTR